MSFSLTDTAENIIQTANASNKAGIEMNKLRFATRFPVAFQKSASSGRQSVRTGLFVGSAIGAALDPMRTRVDTATSNQFSNRHYLPCCCRQYKSAVFAQS